MPRLSCNPWLARHDGETNRIQVIAGFGVPRNYAFQIAAKLKIIKRCCETLAFPYSSAQEGGSGVDAGKSVRIAESGTLTMPAITAGCLQRRRRGSTHQPRRGTRPLNLAPYRRNDAENIRDTANASGQPEPQRSPTMGRPIQRPTEQTRPRQAITEPVVQTSMEIVQASTENDSGLHE